MVIQKMNYTLSTGFLSLFSFLCMNDHFSESLHIQIVLVENA